MSKRSVDNAVIRAVKARLRAHHAEPEALAEAQAVLRALMAASDDDRVRVKAATVILQHDLAVQEYEEPKSQRVEREHSGIPNKITIEFVEPGQDK